VVLEQQQQLLAVQFLVPQIQVMAAALVVIIMAVHPLQENLEVKV
jgi:hypothetical protein